MRQREVEMDTDNDNRRTVLGAGQRARRVRARALPAERARRLFYHIRSIGEARPRAGYRFGHQDLKGFLFHLVLAGQMWFRARRRVHVARAGDCYLLDFTDPLEYGNDGPRRRTCCGCTSTGC